MLYIHVLGISGLCRCRFVHRMPTLTVGKMGVGRLKTNMHIHVLSCLLTRIRGDLKRL